MYSFEEIKRLSLLISDSAKHFIASRKADQLDVSAICNNWQVVFQLRVVADTFNLFSKKVLLSFVFP
jgi:hypothetical protein